MHSNRLLAGLAALAVAASGAAWSGCDDDEEDAQQVIEDAQKQLEEGLNQAQQEGEETQKQVDKALEDAGY
jgi:uncharacterized protein YdgA (DUF945 family)